MGLRVLLTTSWIVSRWVTQFNLFFGNYTVFHWFIFFSGKGTSWTTQGCIRTRRPRDPRRGGCNAWHRKTFWAHRGSRERTFERSNALVRCSTRWEWSYSWSFLFDGSAACTVETFRPSRLPWCHAPCKQPSISTHCSLRYWWECESVFLLILLSLSLSLSLLIKSNSFIRVLLDMELLMQKTTRHTSSCSRHWKSRRELFRMSFSVTTFFHQQQCMRLTPT